MVRSYFENALEVLTCINIGSSEYEDVCALVEIGETYYQEIIDSLREWELVNMSESRVILSERGKNILSYYHDPTIIEKELISL